MKELVIKTYGDVTFSYSIAHFDDIIANDNNLCVLRALEICKACEIVANEERKHQVESDGARLTYVDPSERLDKYRNHMAENQAAIQPFLDIMMAIQGGPVDDFRSKIPVDILALSDELDEFESEAAKNIKQSVIAASVEMESALKDFQPESLPITRTGLGLQSGASGVVSATSYNAIEKIWDKINPREEGITIETYFGTQLSNDLANGESRVATAPLCHAMLNLIGYYPDGGLTDQEKQAAIMADGNHIAFGSYCDCFLTSDQRLFNKAKAIYEYKRYPSKLGKLKYNSEGMELQVFDPAVVDLLPKSDTTEYIRDNPIIQTN